tara:strand:+ start:1613 stop:2806 length:1194 start_codon:yes stop_codon:yes gene_type:complete
MNMNEKLWKEFKNSKNQNKIEESLDDMALSVFEETLLEEDAWSSVADSLKSFLRTKGYSDENFEQKKSSAYVTVFKLLVPLSRDDRRELSLQMKNELAGLDFVYDHTHNGAGRFTSTQDPRDKVYFYIKPSGKARTRPQDAGEQYEKDLEASLGEFFSGQFSVTTAGFGHGSDIVLSSPDGNINLSIEAKTNIGADFGQGTARYELATNEWEINETNQMKKSPDKLALFQAILNQVREAGNLPSFLTLDEKGVGTNSEKYGDIYIEKKGYVFGLKRSEKTPELAGIIRSDWFGDRESLYIPYDASTITKYYASKGDNLMQIKGYGLYALNQETADLLGIPLFGEGLRGQIRFRLKQHGGKYGRHSFTLANQVRGKLEPTTMDLDDLSSLSSLMSMLS